jgi:hypothetical protein
MPNHLIVWDIETVPDLRGFAAANGRTVLAVWLLPFVLLHRLVNLTLNCFEVE